MHYAAEKEETTNPQLSLNNSRTENLFHTQPCKKIPPQ